MSEMILCECASCNRLRALQSLIVQGITARNEQAARLGVSRHTASRYLTALRGYGQRAIIVCAACQEKHQAHRAFGWCGACYQRWRMAGCPEPGPPPKGNNRIAIGLAAAHAAIQAATAERIAEWRHLRGALPPDEIAAKLGVSLRTVQRYEHDARAAEQEVTRVMRLLRGTGLWADAA